MFRLQKTITFSSQLFNYMGRAMDVVESVNPRCTYSTSWNKLTVTWWWYLDQPLGAGLSIRYCVCIWLLLRDEHPEPWHVNLTSIFIVESKSLTPPLNKYCSLSHLNWERPWNERICTICTSTQLEDFVQASKHRMPPKEFCESECKCCLLD